MTRLEATRVLLDAISDEPALPIVASLGHPAYDLFAVSDRPANFYTWGSMGLATSIGLGLAIAQPDRRIIALDGDGSLLMNLGSLATIGWTRPPKLIVVVWDNEEYATTGGQQTATAHGADLAMTARALGLESASVDSAAELRAALDRARAARGPWAIVAKVKESAPAGKPPLDCVYIKQRFMAAIGVPEAATRG
jgi:thiamine pyrophosphate-dependent acetolactate synthase large subunit-like protein